MHRHFFIVGAQRCGTTYLYHQLAAHPEIEMAQPVRPEPKFFLLDELYQHGIDHYETTYFQAGSAALLRGEKSTSYIESEKAARRIARHFPDAKILVLLRDPIERAISNYWLTANYGLDTLPMTEAFLLEEERRDKYDRQRVSVSPYAYLKRGQYIDYLVMYERYFPLESLLVLVYEQLVGSLEAVQRVYDCLGAASDFVPPTLNEAINVGSKPSTELPPELESYLIQHFAESNAQIAERYGLGISSWNRSVESTKPHDTTD